jgi:hypothetical protein
MYLHPDHRPSRPSLLCDDTKITPHSNIPYVAAVGFALRPDLFKLQVSAADFHNQPATAMHPSMQS